MDWAYVLPHRPDDCGVAQLLSPSVNQGRLPPHSSCGGSTFASSRRARAPARRPRSSATSQA